jgi:D-alanine-D-alanine ligase
MLRVVHLTGSAVSAFLEDLSRVYAEDCLTATADPSRYAFSIAHVTPDGRWRFPDDLSREAIASAPAMPIADAVGRLVALNPDVMVPQMFCIPGMTRYRALFNLLGIPYIGNTPEVMALAAHKARAKAVVAASGVNVPPGEVLRAGDSPTIGLPVVVKPVDSDNSLGLTLVREQAEHAAALADALQHAGEVLVEAFIPLGREVRAGCIVRDGEVICLPLEEYAVDPDHAPIRTHDDKIGRTAGGALQLMAKQHSRAWNVDPGDPITAAVHEATRRSHAALGARHYSLFDFRIDPAGVPWFLEASPYCSFARASVISMMAAAAGIPIDQLFADMLDEALR